jgi:hypothetical protein
MPIRRSHGKARAEMPRARDLLVVRTEPDRTDARRSDGRFAPGNAGGKGRGWKRAIVELLARGANGLSDVATRVAANAWTLYSASLRGLPASDSPIVRSLAARRARHEALESYWSAQAIAKLGTAEGKEAEDRASAHGKEATRITVVLFEASRVVAASKPPPAVWPAWPAPQPAREDDEPSREDGPGTLDEQADGQEDVELETAVHEAPGREVVSPERAAPIRRPMTREQIDEGLMARVVAPRASTPPGLCKHALGPSSCLACFHERQAAKPSSAPWRSLLPRTHRDWRPA